MENWKPLINPPTWVLNIFKKKGKIGSFIVKGKTFEYKLVTKPTDHNFYNEYFIRKRKFS